MNPYLRLCGALLLSLAVWFPTMLASMHGEVTVDAAVVRYLWTFAFAWFGTGIISRVIGTYAVGVDLAAAEAADDEVEAVFEERRRS